LAEIIGNRPRQSAYKIEHETIYCLSFVVVAKCWAIIVEIKLKYELK